VQFARIERLDAGLRADRHEHGRLDDAASRGQFSKTRFRVRVSFEEFKHLTGHRLPIDFGFAQIFFDGTAHATVKFFYDSFSERF
jgi:hypothetical protein